MQTRKARNIHGTTNRVPRHLCQQANPAETVASYYMSNIDNQRHISNQLNDSLIPTVDAILSKDRSQPPPQLPTANVALSALPKPGDKKPDKVLLSGLAGILPAADNTTGVNDHESRKTMQVMIPSHRHGVAPTGTFGALEATTMSSSPKRLSARSNATTNDSESVARGQNAALAFVGGSAGKLPSGVTPTLPPMPVIHTRMEKRDDHAKLTFGLTQPDQRSSQYINPTNQYASSGRGLEMGLLMQQDKMHKLAAKETKTSIRREKEAAVVASRVADGDRGVRITEGRIRSKAKQYETYKERLSQYKFTQ